MYTCIGTCIHNINRLRRLMAENKQHGENQRRWVEQKGPAFWIGGMDSRMICFLNTLGEVVYTVTEPNSCLADLVNCSVSELLAPSPPGICYWEHSKVLPRDLKLAMEGLEFRKRGRRMCRHILTQIDAPYLLRRLRVSWGEMWRCPHIYIPLLKVT